MTFSIIKDILPFVDFLRLSKEDLYHEIYRYRS